MQKKQGGFSIIELIIVLATIGAIGALGYYAYGRIKEGENAKKTPVAQTSQQKFAEKPIKSLGFNLDSYDKETGKAGDFVFTKQALYDEFLFLNFGSTRQKADSSETKGSAQPTFLLPIGTKVHAIADGTIFRITKLYSGDYSVMIDVGNPDLYFEMEHVSDVSVKEGDTVKASEVIAKVSSHNSKNNAGLGLFEVGVLKHGNPPSHLCFFDYVDDSVKPELDKKILNFYESWEAYKGDSSIYDEDAMPTPGCDSRAPISDTNSATTES